MELWYTEQHTKNVRFSVKTLRQVCDMKSDFQHIAIFDSKEFGRFLTLDGYMMLTERDEFIYHEMLVHVPMAVHPCPRRVLVIGGGDGGAVRELSRYPFLESIDLVEIDPLVIEASRRYLPFTARGLEDPRVRIYYEDGVRFSRARENEYDVILVDSTDPFGPGEGLFTKEFFGSCFKALKEDGILVNQHESPFYADDAAAVRRIHRRMSSCFPICRVYQANIPSYPSGHWLFGFASKKYDPMHDLHAGDWNSLGLRTNYYTTNLHEGCFRLPAYVERMLDDVE